MLSFAFENSEPDRVVSQADDRVTGFAPIICLDKVVDAAIDHFQRNRREWLSRSAMASVRSTKTAYISQVTHN